jgi:diamine N-acetyltransferase
MRSTDEAWYLGLMRQRRSPFPAHWPCVKSGMVPESRVIGRANPRWGSTMDITFRPVTWENFSAVTELTVTPEQANFVAPNLYSIAEAYLEPTWTPLAIYTRDALVGFAMFGRDDQTGRWWIMRYMIDAQHQGKGYGTAALPGLIDLIVERHGCSELFLDYSLGNEVAARLYARMGFVPTGEVEAGEIIARLDLATSR